MSAQKEKERPAVSEPNALNEATTHTGALSTRFQNSGKPRPRFGRVPQYETASEPLTEHREIRVTEGRPQRQTSHWLRDIESRKGEKSSSEPRWLTNDRRDAR
jgi:hypothetical protein